MKWPYQYRLYIWPSLACGVLLAVLSVYAWRRHTAPSALPFAGIFTATAYGLTLSRFRMFKLFSNARGTAFEQMREGMLIVDCQQHIIDLNPAAEEILGVAAARARGAVLAEAFPECVASAAEIIRGEGDTARYYTLHRSALNNRRGFPLGSLILLHDITEERRALSDALEQRCALATLRERDRVARELHDSLGQVLGYVKMQTEAARALLARNRASEADACLAQLSAVAQDAHADVREYIFSALAVGCENPPLLPTLNTYLQRFTEHYGIVTKLSVAPGLADRPVEPTVKVQLLRIIQEALSNVRKHAGECDVQIRLGFSDSQAEVVIEDDGLGFDVGLPNPASEQKFGLSIMRERAQEVGGSVKVHSAIGKGTQVVIRVPLRKELV